MNALVLHQPPTRWGTPNTSPFCAKLETYLRMVDIPYTIADGDKFVGDSQLIVGGFASPRSLAWEQSGGAGGVPLVR